MLKKSDASQRVSPLMLGQTMRKQIEVSTRVGFGLVELFVVIGIIAILIGLTLPAVQRIRESSRIAACKNNLRQIGFAISNYESSQMRFPPGTVGYGEIVEWNDYRNVTSSPFWKRKPNTSFATLVLPFMGENNDANLLASAMFDLRNDLTAHRNPDGSIIGWFGEARGFPEIASRSIPTLTCPSDDMSSLSNTLKYTGGSQPVTKDGVDAMSFTNLSALLPGRYVGAKYLGCAGVNSGRQDSHQRREQFMGVMSSGSIVRFSNVSDGGSNTLMVGETLGAVKSGFRVFAQCWVVGGLARGRGSNTSAQLKESGPVIGDLSKSNGFGFGSVHSRTNFLFADGSVRGIEPLVEPELFFRLCGISDGGLSNDQ